MAFAQRIWRRFLKRSRSPIRINATCRGLVTGTPGRGVGSTPDPVAAFTQVQVEVHTLAPEVVCIQDPVVACTPGLVGVFTRGLEAGCSQARAEVCTRGPEAVCIPDLAAVYTPDPAAALIPDPASTITAFGRQGMSFYRRFESEERTI